MNTFRFVYPLIRPHLALVLLGVLLIPPSTFCALSLPRLTGRAVDTILRSPQNLGPIYPLGGWILLYALGRGLCLLGTRYCIITGSRRMEYDLRNKLFRHLLSLDRPFFDSVRTGDLMSRATSDVDATRTIAGPGVMYSISTLFMLAVAVPLMVSVDPVLTLLIMIPLSLLSLTVRVIGPRVQASYRRAQETLAELSSFAQENAAGIRVVKSFALEDRESNDFRDLCEKYYEHNLRTERISNWMHPIVGAVSHLSVILLLVVAGYMILRGGFTLGEFVQFSGYQSMLIWPMISIGWVVNQVFRGVASVARLQEIFARKPTVAVSVEGRPDETVPLDRPAFRGEVEIRGLTFSYGGDPVLRDISLHIPAGKTVALIGRTGAGKSTLAHLIPRLYPVPGNTIFLDGVDITELPLRSLRQAIGFVPQETFLFSRTIAENIAFGVDGGEGGEWLDEVDRFAGVSRLDKDIDQFNLGLHAVVGERGVTLSGGQKQRVAISRALLYKSSMLILDDALSAVDTHTEEEIVHNLREATQNLTVLVISHRISSIKGADRIYVMDEGRIVEHGTHDELVSLGGLYRELYELQLLERELEEM